MPEDGAEADAKRGGFEGTAAFEAAVCGSPPMEEARLCNGEPLCFVSFLSLTLSGGRQYVMGISLCKCLTIVGNTDLGHLEACRCLHTIVRGAPRLKR